MNRRMLRACLALSTCLAVAGCAPGNRPVARVGTRTLTVDDFAVAARGNESSIPAPPEQAKRLFLEQWVGEQALVAAAHARGDDTTSRAREFRRGIEEQLLLQALQRELVPADVGVSEAELRRLWAERATQFDARLVFAYDEATIRHAAAALAAGQSFEAVADLYNPPGALPPGGVVTDLQPGTLPPGVDGPMRGLREGQVGGPYSTLQGWFLIKVTKRTSITQQPFELQRSMLEEILRQRKLRVALMTGFFGLQDAYHMRLQPGGSQTVFRFLEPFRIGGGQHWMPDAKDRQQVLGTWDGGAYTLGDALADLDRSDLQKPNPSFEPGLARWLEDRMGTRVAVAEARRRHLDETAEFRRQLRAREDQYVLQGAYNLAMAALGPATDSLARVLWDRVKENNPVLQRARVAWVVVADTTVARALVGRAMTGMGLAEAAAAVSPALAVRVDEVSYPNDDPRWNAAQSMIANAAPGAWAQPLYVGTGWQMMQVLDKVQAVREWKDLPEDARHEIEGRVQSMEREQRMAAYRDSVSRAIAPVLMPENLRFVAWPVPAPIDVGS